MRYRDVLKPFHSSAGSTVPALIAAAGVGMLLYGVGVGRPLWVDEQMILLNLRDRSFAELAGPLWLDQSAPLGWMVVERFILLVFGEGERAVRLLTAAFGSATLMTALWIGRRWMTPFGASALVILCATGEWLVFFTLELKHYSADAFWALLLPAIAAWAIEARDRPDTLVRRARTWWLAAAAGQWFANGALFVAPATAVMLVAVCWRRAGLAALRPMAIGAAAWMVAFGLNFSVTLRPALGNEYLKTYWAFAFPPVAEGAAATAAWLLRELQPRAVKPGGTQLWLLFWIAWTIGIGHAVVRRNVLGWMYAAVPLSALALALFGFVPLFERLGIWYVPSLYVGVALCADAAVRAARRQASRHLATAAFAALAGATALAVCADVAYRGLRTFVQRPRSNYGLDDRSSIRYLLATHRRGDPILTTHYGAAALWWYGRVNLLGPDGGVRLDDGSPIFEVRYPDQRECAAWDPTLTRTLAPYTRADVYLGFRLNVEPEHFDSLVLSVLSRRGQMVGYKEYAEDSRVAAFDLTRSTAHGDSIPGCISIRPAKRW